ncbi:MAG: hypothetical protein ABI628_00965 [Chloroflexota bacterium]
MPMWRCPHCGTPQAEAARCWVCRRSSTSCATCANFRHAVFGASGYCGLDRGRSPLVGDEIRACWTAPTTLVAERLPIEAAAGERPFGPTDADGLPLGTDPGLDPPSRFWVEIDA